MKTLLLLLAFVLTGCSQANCDKEIAAYKEARKDYQSSTYSSSAGSLQSVMIMFPALGSSATFAWGGGFGCSVTRARFPAVY